MKPILTLITAGILLSGLAVGQPVPGVRLLGYRLIDLGTLGGSYSFGFGINYAGEVAGQAATAAQTDGFAGTAYLWSEQKGIHSLGVLGQPFFPTCATCNSGAAAVGSSGDVAMGSEIATLDPNGEDFGQWDPPNPTHRVTRVAVWRNGILSVLPNLPGGNNANVFWINNLGQISGVAENATFDASCATVTPFQVRRFQPVIWGPNGDIQRILSPLVAKGDTAAYAFTINDNGQAVGASGVCANIGLPPFAINNTVATHAVLWDKDGSGIDLGSLGGTANIANSINNHGEVVGTSGSLDDGTIHTFRWSRQTGMVDYGAFPGAVATVAGCCHTINDRGEVVGFSIEPENPFFGRALVWQGATPKDLNDFVRDPGPFVHLTNAFSINESGAIVCQGITESGELHACLAVPDHGPGGNASMSAARRSGGTVRPTDEVRDLLRRRLGMSPR